MLVAFAVLYVILIGITLRVESNSARGICQFDDFQEIKRHGFTIYYKIPGGCEEVSLFESSVDNNRMRLFVESLKNFPHIKELDLARNEIDDIGLEMLASAFSAGWLYFLKSLRLGHNKFTTSGTLKLLSAIKNHESLQELHLDYNNLTDSITDDLFSTSASIQKLSLVNLEQCNLSIDSISRCDDFMNAYPHIELRTTAFTDVTQRESLATDLYVSMFTMEPNFKEDPVVSPPIHLIEEYGCKFEAFETLQTIIASLGIENLENLTKLEQDEIVDHIEDPLLAIKVQRCARIQICLHSSLQDLLVTDRHHDVDRFHFLLDKCDENFYVQTENFVEEL